MTEKRQDAAKHSRRSRSANIQRVNRKRRDRGSRRVSIPVARFALATFIILIWAAIYLKAFFDSSFDPPEGLSGVAIAAATYLFGSGLLNSKDKNGDGK